MPGRGTWDMRLTIVEPINPGRNLQYLHCALDHGRATRSPRPAGRQSLIESQPNKSVSTLGKCMWVRPKTAKRTYRHAASLLFLSSRVVTHFSSHFELDFAFSDAILITHSRVRLA